MRKVKSLVSRRGSDRQVHLTLDTTAVRPGGLMTGKVTLSLKHDNTAPVIVLLQSQEYVVEECGSDCARLVVVV